MKKLEALRVVTKFGLTERRGKEFFFKLVYGGVTILTTAVPKGKGDLRIEGKFRQQLRLNEYQLAEAIRCPFGEREYLQHLKTIGLIS